MACTSKSSSTREGPYTRVSGSQTSCLHGFELNISGCGGWGFCVVQSLRCQGLPCDSLAKAPLPPFRGQAWACAAREKFSNASVQKQENPAGSGAKVGDPWSKVGQAAQAACPSPGLKVAQKGLGPATLVAGRHATAVRPETCAVVGCVSEWS